ncbi:Rieske (2Fe-2S) protein [Pseudonocardia sp. RS010]|uniref:Rieske (2Fe-2S) protein n=1 Tax=Pseudonocardia sp. RS010 TaxID=3385979 RepID=UPI0039A07413
MTTPPTRSTRSPGRARRHVVAKVDDIPDGERLIVEVGGRSIGVFNIRGTFHALLNRCPHNGAALCEGPLTDVVRAERPGQTTFDESRVLVQCPWHGWEFDIETGRSYTDPERSRVRRYGSVVAPGPDVRELVAIGEVGDAVTPQPTVPGPIHRTLVRERSARPPAAERIDVAVDDDYVVVTLR